MNDAGLPDNCNCGDCGFPACGDCDCDYYGEDCCTGGHGSPATSSWPNQHECREYNGDYGDCCANEAMGDPAACAYGYCPTHQPQSYDGCEDGGNYGCNPGDCWGVETVYASAESYSESEDAILGLLLTAPINGGMCQPACRDFVPQALGSQCHGLALDWLPRTFDEPMLKAITSPFCACEDCLNPDEDCAAGFLPNEMTPELEESINACVGNLSKTAEDFITPLFDMNRRRAQQTSFPEGGSGEQDHGSGMADGSESETLHPSETLMALLNATMNASLFDLSPLGLGSRLPALRSLTKAAADLANEFSLHCPATCVDVLDAAQHSSCGPTAFLAGTFGAPAAQFVDFACREAECAFALAHKMAYVAFDCMSEGESWAAVGAQRCCLCPSRHCRAALLYTAPMPLDIPDRFHDAIGAFNDAVSRSATTGTSTCCRRTSTSPFSSRRL